MLVVIKAKPTVGGSLVAAFNLGGLVLALSSTFIVHQTQQILLLRFGQPVRVVLAPGIGFKLPLIDSIVEIDNRIIALGSPKREIILSDQRRLVVDAVARYKIVRPLEFYQTDPSIAEANFRLLTLFDSSIRRVLSTATIHVAGADRPGEMGAQQLGITIVDVRIGRVVLPVSVSAKPPRSGQRGTSMDRKFVLGPIGT
jgi:modulator of FtsH protease HflC